MTLLREQKIAGIADDIPPLEVDGDPEGEILVIGWGSTFGAVKAGVRRARKTGLTAAHVHLRHLHPLPRDLEEIMSRYRVVLVPELNRGQLTHLLRATLLADVIGYSKIQGLPFKASEIETKILEVTSS
jgi:2-oxoglutarate/2-oxoacid ferredoxin oxidoreductase subunit alpha